MRRFVFLSVLVLLSVVSFSLLSAPHSAFAQTVRGSLAGTVTDPSGAVIPGATIAAKNAETGALVKTISTSSGAYRFPELPLGHYDVTVSAPGFKQQIYTGVLIQVQQVSALDLKLDVGSATESITVSADSPQVEAETSDQGGVVSTKQILELPLALGGVGQLRSPESFMFLIPGTAGPGTANNNNGIYLNKIAGGQDYGNEVLLDGGSVQRSENGSSFDQESPSVEALQEFKLTTSLPQAEYGRTTGGIENFVTKSGTNEFHGSVFDIFRNTALDANSWFSNGYRALNCVGANNTPTCNRTYARGTDDKNDYGVNVGGPLVIPHLYNGHNRLFFFFSWEKLHYDLSHAVTTTVPTDAEKQGDFSNPAIFNPAGPSVGTNPCDGKPVYNGEIFDPSTTRTVTLANGSSTECREPFTGNKLTHISPAAAKLMSFFPEAQNQGLIANNYTYNGPTHFDNTTYSIRIDANLSQKSKIFASYNTRENNIISGSNPILPYPIDPNTWTQDFITHFGRVGWDYSFTPNTLNHFILGYNRSNSINIAQAVSGGVNWTSQLGIAGVVSDNFPVVTNGFTDTEGIAQNADNIDNGMRLADSLRWQKGRHSIAFGADVRWQQYSPIDRNNPGLAFSGNQTAGAPSLTGTGNGLASELLGEASNGTQTDYLHLPRWTSWYYALYVQDDFKVTKDLTLNLGIRYDVDLPRHEAKNDTSNFSPTALDPEYGVPGALVFGSTCGNCNAAWANAYFKDIGPRIGFAYAPSSMNGKMAVRGGAGIVYGPLQYSDFGGAMVTGYQTTESVTNNGFDPSFQIDSGYPAFKAPPNLDPGFYNGTYVANSYIQPQDGKPAAIYQWNVEVQQEMAKDLIFSIGYIGNRAQNLHSNLENINNISLADLALGPKLNDLLNGNKDGVSVPFANFYQLWGTNVAIQHALRPFSQYDYIDSGCCLQNIGHSSYDALVSSLKRQFRQGLNLMVSYTWEKTETDSDSLLPNNGVGVAQDQDPTDLRTDKAISAQDIPQTLVVSYLYQLPFGRDKKWFTSGWTNAAFGGWEIGGVQRYQSGQPESFCCQAGIPGYEQSVRFNRIPDTTIKSAIYKKGWRQINPFNTASGSNPNVNSLYNGSNVNSAYSGNPAAQASAAFDPQIRDANTAYSNSGGKIVLPYTLGNTPRVTGEVRTPPYLNEDFSVLKTTSLPKGIKFEMKFEFLNAFNRHVWSLPDQAPTDFLVGVPTATLTNPRNMQVQARLMF